MTVRGQDRGERGKSHWRRSFPEHIIHIGFHRLCTAMARVREGINEVKQCKTRTNVKNHLLKSVRGGSGLNCRSSCLD